MVSFDTIVNVANHMGITIYDMECQIRGMEAGSTCKQVKTERNYYEN